MNVLVRISYKYNYSNNINTFNYETKNFKILALMKINGMSSSYQIPSRLHNLHSLFKILKGMHIFCLHD